MLPKEKILIIDSDPKRREENEQILRSVHYAYMVASADTNLSTLEENNSITELALVSMPVNQQQTELIQALESHIRRPYFLYLLSEQSHQQASEALELGADELLRYPFTSHDLIAKLHLLTERRRREHIGQPNEASTGLLDDISIRELIELFMLGGGTATTNIQSASYKGSLYFQEGHLIGVTLNQHQGFEALIRLLQIADGSFEIVPETSIDLGEKMGRIEVNDPLSIASESLIRWNELLQQLPPRVEHIQVDYDIVQKNFDQLNELSHQLLWLLTAHNSLEGLLNTLENDSLPALEELVRLYHLGIFKQELPSLSRMRSVTPTISHESSSDIFGSFQEPIHAHNTSDFDNILAAAAQEAAIHLVAASQPIDKASIQNIEPDRYPSFFDLPAFDTYHQEMQAQQQQNLESANHVQSFSDVSADAIPSLLEQLRESKEQTTPPPTKESEHTSSKSKNYGSDKSTRPKMDVFNTPHLESEPNLSSIDDLLPPSESLTSLDDLIPFDEQAPSLQDLLPRNDEPFGVPEDKMASQDEHLSFRDVEEDYPLSNENLYSTQKELPHSEKHKLSTRPNKIAQLIEPKDVLGISPSSFPDDPATIPDVLAASESDLQNILNNTYNTTPNEDTSINPEFMKTEEHQPFNDDTHSEQINSHEEHPIQINSHEEVSDILTTQQQSELLSESDTLSTPTHHHENSDTPQDAYSVVSINNYDPTTPFPDSTSSELLNYSEENIPPLPPKIETVSEITNDFEKLALQATGQNLSSQFMLNESTQLLNEFMQSELALLPLELTDKSTEIISEDEAVPSSPQLLLENVANKKSHDTRPTPTVILEPPIGDSLLSPHQVDDVEIQINVEDLTSSPDTSDESFTETLSQDDEAILLVSKNQKPHTAEYHSVSTPPETSSNKVNILDPNSYNNLLEKHNDLSEEEAYDKLLENLNNNDPSHTIPFGVALPSPNIPENEPPPVVLSESNKDTTKSKEEKPLPTGSLIASESDSFSTIAAQEPVIIENETPPETEKPKKPKKPNLESLELTDDFFSEYPFEDSPRRKYFWPVSIFIVLLAIIGGAYIGVLRNQDNNSNSTNDQTQGSTKTQPNQILTTKHTTLNTTLKQTSLDAGIPDASKQLAQLPDQDKNQLPDTNKIIPEQQSITQPTKRKPKPRLVKLAKKQKNKVIKRRKRRVIKRRKHRVYVSRRSHKKRRKRRRPKRHYSSKTVKTLLRKAKRQKRREQFRSAERTLRKALKLAGRNKLQVFVLLGHVLYERNKAKSALRYLMKAYRISPRRTASGLVTLGSIYYEKSQLSRARKYYKQYLKYYPRGKHARDVRNMLRNMN